LSGYTGKASIGALCVDPDYRRRGIGSRLYDDGERFLAAQGAAAISVVHYPGHLTPGIPVEATELKAFFDRRGFQGWTEASDLRRQLDDYPAGGRAEVEWRGPGVRATLRPAREGEQAAIMAFLGREFAGGWEYETTRFFDAGGEPADITIAESAGTVIGFCRTYTPESLHLAGSTHWFPLLRRRWGGLGPIGIAAARRGHGLGRALLRYSITLLKQRGVDDMVIDWTVLERFYGKAGFGVWKRYWLGSKARGNGRMRSAPA
jgi:predicted N-acetyltransferase YhbS